MESCPTAAFPVPDSGIVSVGFEASEEIVTLPLALPEDPGANLTCKFVLWPAANVSGTVIPLNVKPAPLVATCEMVTLEPPMFVMVSEMVLFCPTVRLPKLSEEGFGLSVPAEAMLVPVPDRATVTVGSEASEVMVTLPVAFPADNGANATLKVALCPAGTVRGVESPLNVKPVPLIPTCEIVTFEPPVLVIVSERV
jgi:hypothetical protein